MSYFKKGCIYSLIDRDVNDSIAAEGMPVLVLEDMPDDIHMRWALTHDGKVRRVYISSYLRQEIV